jgi:hypothetical protein
MTRLFIGFVSDPAVVAEIFGAKARVTLTTATALAAGGGSTKTFSGISTESSFETTIGELARGVKTLPNAVTARCQSTT